MSPHQLPLPFPPMFGDPYYDPFQDPLNRVESWITRSTGQFNREIVSGPDKDLHQGYDPQTGATFQSAQNRKP